jgi:CheY-like chemotaxis protein
MSRILIVDDEASILKSLQRLLRVAPCAYGGKQFPLEVHVSTSPTEALRMAQHEDFDLFISDYRMPEMDGIEFLKAAKSIQPDAARLILSGYADLNALVRAVNEVGIERFIGKPWNDYDLMSAIGQALSIATCCWKTVNWPIWYDWKWATRPPRNWKPSAWSVSNQASPRSTGGRMARSSSTRHRTEASRTRKPDQQARTGPSWMHSSGTSAT